MMGANKMAMMAKAKKAKKAKSKKQCLIVKKEKLKKW